MFTIIKTIILIKILGVKIRHYERWRKRIDKRYSKIIRRAKWIDERLFQTKMRRSYTTQNTNPDEVWDQRAERESLKSNL